MTSKAVKLRQEKLLNFIGSNRPTRLDILNKLYNLQDSGIRKFQRDLDALRTLYDVSFDQERYTLINRSRTASIFENVLSNEEKLLLQRIQKDFDASHPYFSDVQLLLEKLAGYIDENSKVTGFHRYFGPRFTRDYKIYRPIIQELEKAIRRKQKVSFIYNRPVSRELENVNHYEVEPQVVEVKHGVFYLHGYSLKMAKSYDYRIDKISDLKILPAKFAAFRKPTDEIEFEYILEARVVKGGISERFDNQEVLAILPDGRAHLRATGRSFWIKQELLRLGSSATLVSPQWLKTEMVKELETMCRNYDNVWNSKD
jgi:WYL domain